jgi:serine/threonine protein kinase
MPGLPTLSPGAVFAREFKVERLLAEGGMGAVYIVEQLSTGKRRALKIMLPALVEDRRARERFAMESRIGSQIESEHIVEIVGAGIDDATQTPWLAMELLEGQDLSQLVRARGRLSVEETVEILQQLGDALGAAHAKGIVHRDLKPENLFISVSRRRGVPFTLKILDFGIAKLSQENRATASATAAIGSPMWMAPEQTEQTTQLRPSTDVWALGLIAFHMLTGRFYWRVANEEAVRLTALFTEVLVTPLDPPSVRAAQLGVGHLIPPAFDVWFSRCVARAPDQRYAEAGSAIAAIGPGFTLRDATGSAVALPSGRESSRRIVAATALMPAHNAQTPAHISQYPPPYSPGGHSPSGHSGSAPGAYAPPPYVPTAPLPHQATSTPYSASGPTTATGPVARPSGGLGRMVMVAAGLLLLLGGGAGATFAGLLFYEQYAGGHTSIDGPAHDAVDSGAVLAVDAATAIDAATDPDAGVPLGVDPDLVAATDDPRPERHHVRTSTTTEADPAPAGGYDWADGATHPFNGTYRSDGFRYQMTFTITRSGGSASGSIFVVCEEAPSGSESLVGRSAMEWVRGTINGGALVLTGYQSTSPDVWTTGTYHLTITESGSVSGRGTDGGRISGHM